MIISIISKFPTLDKWDSTFLDYLPKNFLALLALVLFNERSNYEVKKTF